MASKINGEGVKGPIPVIQAPAETITCRRCRERKARYKKDFPYCYSCYQEMIRTGEMQDDS